MNNILGEIRRGDEKRNRSLSILWLLLALMPVLCVVAVMLRSTTFWIYTMWAWGVIMLYLLFRFAQVSANVFKEIAACSQELKGVADLDTLAGAICECSTIVGVRFMLYLQMRKILEDENSSTSKIEPPSAPTIQALLAYDPLYVSDSPLVRFWRLQLLIMLLDHKDRWMSAGWDVYVHKAQELASERGYVTKVILGGASVTTPTNGGKFSKQHAVQISCARRLAVFVAINCIVHIALAVFAARLIILNCGWQLTVAIFFFYLGIAFIMRLFLANVFHRQCLDIAVNLTWLNSQEHMNSYLILLLISPTAYVAAPEIPFALALITRAFKCINHDNSQKRPWMFKMKPAMWQWLMLGPQYFIQGRDAPEIAFQNQIFLEFNIAMNKVGVAIS